MFQLNYFNIETSELNLLMSESLCKNIMLLDKFDIWFTSMFY